MRNERLERHQVVALGRERGRPLPLGAAQVDPLAKIDESPEMIVERRIARRDSAHRLRGIAVATRTRLVP